MGELLAGVGNREVWLALDEDGAPLPLSAGPIKLIVPQDEKPARWVHAIQGIHVLDATAPATRPAD